MNLICPDVLKDVGQLMNFRCSDNIPVNLDVAFDEQVDVLLCQFYVFRRDRLKKCESYNSIITVKFLTLLCKIHKKLL